jgi:hypothetical protein
MTEQLEFNLDSGLELKKLGMALAANNNTMLLKISRNAAERIALERGVVTSDDVRVHLNLRPNAKRDSNNWMGSIFRDKRFVWTGHYINSKLPLNHAAPIKVWRLA